MTAQIRYCYELAFILVGPESAYRFDEPVALLLSDQLLHTAITVRRCVLVLPLSSAFWTVPARADYIPLLFDPVAHR